LVRVYRSTVRPTAVRPKSDFSTLAGASAPPVGGCVVAKAARTPTPVRMTGLIQYLFLARLLNL
jgi:hypothetical protein